MSKEKYQRVRIEDAEKMLENLIKNYKSVLGRAVSYDEDYAGGSEAHINESIVKDLIKKLCR